MKKYDRDSFYLATKLPLWFVDSREKAAQIFEEQLKKLQMDYVDFYLLHSMNKEHFELCKKLDLFSFCDELKRQGKIRYFGFSFHDSYEVFEEIINYRKWDFCQIQLNYMDTEDGPGMRGYELAEKLGVPVVIMEPVKGGTLANLSPDLRENLEAVNPGKSTASFALRFVGSLPGVKVILSGMSNEEQVEDNLNTFDNFVPLSNEERNVIEKNKKIMQARVQNSCTGCRYCMPCPAGVNIPEIFKTWNTYHMYQNYWTVNWNWEKMDVKEKPENCIECGKCEKACPQHIAIRDNLKKAGADLANPIYKP
jgi:predicted aldo/keto reductase-like oxidoreductase